MAEIETMNWPVVDYSGKEIGEVSLDKFVFGLSEEEQKVFFKSLSEVASVLKKIFHADKINYAIYGDLVSHFHVHIVPKKKDGPEWGIPFTDMKEKIYLTNEEYLSRIKLIKSSL